jgi:quercetin dioxygenase-like cupin family protein
MNQPVMRLFAAGGVVLGICACLLPSAFATEKKTEKKTEENEKPEKPNQIVIKADDVTDRGPAAPKVRPGRRRRSPPFTVKVMADPVNVQSPQASLTRLIIGPASRVAMHRHPNSAKILYLIKGRARVLGPPGTRPMKLVPGSAVFLPTGYPHIIENMARQAHATFLQAFSPPGPERVYRDPKDTAGRADFEVIRDPARLKAPPGAKPVLASLDSAPALKIAGGKGLARILLEEKTTGSSAMALSVMEFDGGAEVAKHAHTGASELLYVIAGGGKVTVGGETLGFGADNAIFIPADQQHAAKMSGGSTLAVQIYAPAGPEQRYRGANPPAARTGGEKTGAEKTDGENTGAETARKEGQ